MISLCPLSWEGRSKRHPTAGGRKEPDMRRTDRQVTDQAAIRRILDKARVLHLGMLSEEGPYIVPLHYGYEMDEAGRLTFYMHSAKEGRKLDCVAANPAVFVEVDTDESLLTAESPCEYGATFSCVMASGKASILDNAAEKIKALQLMMKGQTGSDFSFTENMVNTVAVIKVECDSYTAKARLAQ